MPPFPETSRLNETFAEQPKPEINRSAPNR
jgi:hypothetical protein